MKQTRPFVQFSDLPPDSPEDFDQQLAAVVDVVARQTRSSPTSESAGVAVRTAHGKSYGLLRARLTVVGDLEAPYAQGLYAVPGEYDAAIRFSNGSGHLRHDTGLGAVCGLGLKIFDVAGPSVLPGDRDAGTFDLALINNPTFFANTAQDYLTIEPLLGQLPDAFATPGTKRQWLTNFLTADGTLEVEQWRWSELLALLDLLAIPRLNLFSYTYWTMGAVRHGDHVAKVRIRPTERSVASIVQRDVDIAGDNEAYRDTLVIETAERSHEFELQVQLSKDLKTMPVHDTTVRWSEAASPFVTVATIDIRHQDIASPDNIFLADASTINPWRVRGAHTPVGEIMAVRRAVYLKSAELRHRINHQSDREPRTLDELFNMDMRYSRRPAIPTTIASTSPDASHSPD